MKIVVDTNRIIAALIKDSISRKIITHLNAELFTINFSEEEINKHKEELLIKSNLNETEFKILLRILIDKLTPLDDPLIKMEMKEAEEIMDKIDPDDTPFIAAAISTNADIWSDDTHFNKQNRIRIWKTSELAKLL